MLRLAKSDAILIQCACQEWQSLLRLTYEVHSKYCERHRMDFLPIHGNLVPENCGKDGSWFNCHIINLAVFAGYQKVIWLDADTLIVNHDEDLRKACPNTGIGASFHIFKDIQPPFYSHWNIGCLYCGIGEEVKTFLRTWWETSDEGHDWRSQHAFNQIEDKQCLREIPNCYNSTPAFPSDNPIVMHWAGAGTMEARYLAMLKEMKKRGFK